MLQTDNPIRSYLHHLKSIGQMVDDSINRNEKFLYRIQASLTKPILTVEKASEINDVICKIAATRKIAYNGGQIDLTGADLKFRLGKAVTHFVMWAHSENIIQRNFYPKNPFPKPHITDAYYLPEPKIWFLYCYDGFDIKTQATIQFLIDTGVRISELCRVKLSDIDFENRTVLINMTKVRRAKIVPLMEKTITTLNRMLLLKKVKSDYLFSVDRNGDGTKRVGQPISTGAVRRKLKKWGNKFGFRINPHSFRHGIATIWYKRYGLLPTAKLLGHIDTKYTLHYSHLEGEEIRDMADDIFKNISLNTINLDKQTSYNINKN